MNFKEELQARVEKVEAVINRFLPKEEGLQKTIMQAMHYSVQAGGKRLRPLIMAETYRLFEGENLKALEPFMAAIEMIHTYSLVHDDLPAMDNDEYRRGRKTTHIVYGEAMGILAGDALLNCAFETACQAFDYLDSKEGDYYLQIAKSLQILSRKAGIYGMIGGQVIDMEECEELVDRERLDLMYRLKTGALLEASMMIGAVMAGANSSEVDKIERIAGDIGLAFQIKDDILDITSSTEVLGKPIGSDEKNDKTTYVTLLGLEAAHEEVLRISKRAVEAYQTLHRSNEFLSELIMMLVNREK